MKSKKQFKWFTIFEYEKEQDYLREMHKSGWKFVSVTGIGTYQFEKCDPEDVVYQLDYNREGMTHKEEYIQMFKDCGYNVSVTLVNASDYGVPQNRRRAVFVGLKKGCFSFPTPTITAPIKKVVAATEIYVQADKSSKLVSQYRVWMNDGATVYISADDGVSLSLTSDQDMPNALIVSNYEKNRIIVAGSSGKPPKYNDGLFIYAIVG